MNRKLTTALASAALLACAALAPSPAAAQDGQTPERTGRRVTKAVTTSCPRHPEVKARSAGKCPKCRMQERRQRAAQNKENAQAEQGTPANEQ